MPRRRRRSAAAGSLYTSSINTGEPNSLSSSGGAALISQGRNPWGSGPPTESRGLEERQGDDNDRLSVPKVPPARHHAGARSARSERWPFHSTADRTPEQE